MLKTNTWLNMDVIKAIERIKTANTLIKNERTGSPKEFAASLGVSTRQLYNIFEFFKDYGATIKYSRTRETFYYTKKDFDLIIDFSITSISEITF
jgi:predicted DNA-binding transcriptional regulator YafY